MAELLLAAGVAFTPFGVVLATVVEQGGGGVVVALPELPFGEEGLTADSFGEACVALATEGGGTRFNGAVSLFCRSDVGIGCGALLPVVRVVQAVLTGELGGGLGATVL